MNSTPEPGTDYGDYEYGYEDGTHIPSLPTTSSSSKDAAYISLTVANVIICVLGLAGNGLVIWIAGFKLKRSINTTWYLSLAVSDFLFCSFLPFSIIYIVKKDWIFGLPMCRFNSFVLFLNMFSSIFLLVIISVDRCVVVMFPVWAQNHRSIRKASVIVVLAWIISAALSSPSIISRKVEFDHVDNKNICFNDYNGLQQNAIVMCRFIFGFMIPFLIIGVCYFIIIRKLKTNQMARSRKPFKIMTALIVTFFISWVLYHTVALMELNPKKYINILHVGQVFGATIASANSCMNPFLYAFMGKDFKKKFFALLSKIENAIEEEGRSSAQRTSITTTGEGKLSTLV